MRESPFLEEVKAEGRTEGRTEGRLEASRASIAEALSVRFGTAAADEFRPVLEQMTDLDRLAELLRLAVKCRRVSEFRRALATNAVTS